jgi:hypothetical protein
LGVEVGRAVLRMRVHLGFYGPTNKLMRIVQHPPSRALFWFVMILIYEAMELPARKRRLRSRIYN